MSYDNLFHNTDHLTGENHVFLLDGLPVIKNVGAKYRKFIEVIEKIFKNKVDIFDYESINDDFKKDSYIVEKIFKYFFQVLLYMYLRKNDNGLILIGFVKNDLYITNDDVDELTLKKNKFVESIKNGENTYIIHLKFVKNSVQNEKNKNKVILVEKEKFEAELEKAKT
jgi:hypothetical protein